MCPQEHSGTLFGSSRAYRTLRGNHTGLGRSREVGARRHESCCADYRAGVLGAQPHYVRHFGDRTIAVHIQSVGLLSGAEGVR